MATGTQSQGSIQIADQADKRPDQSARSQKQAQAQPQPPAQAQPDWAAPFLAALMQCGVVVQACQQARVAREKVYSHARRHPGFARQFEQAKRQGKRYANSPDRPPASGSWQRLFLEVLAETSNVRLAAARAGIEPATAYCLRRRSRRFAAQWQSALYEGYCNLEMEILGQLRDPSSPGQTHVGHALRLLAWHRATHDREQAQRANVSAAEIRASIARKVEELRQTVAAREARTQTQLEHRP